MKYLPLASHRLRIVIVGDVDHGKSTFIGRLLNDAGLLPEEKIESIKKLSEAEGRTFEYAFVLDALREEQAQNITIDTTQIPFRSAKRDYVIIDAPGHREFLKNMMTGAVSADAALLLIDINQGIQDQTRRHLQLLKLLGLEQVIVAINKMDDVHFSHETFGAIVTEVKKLFADFSFSSKTIIPIAAKLGVNITTRSEKMPWYHGATILEAFDALTMPASLEEKPLRFMLQDVYNDEKKSLLVGRIESGTLTIGEEIIFWPAGKKTRIQSIESWNSIISVTQATAGESIAVILEDPLSIKRGSVGSHISNAPTCTQKIEVRLFWFLQQSLSIGDDVIIKLGTQTVEASLASIKIFFDATTLKISDAYQTKIEEYQLRDVIFDLDHAIASDCYENIAPMGRIIISKNKKIAGVGTVLKTSEITKNDDV